MKTKYSVEVIRNDGVRTHRKFFTSIFDAENKINELKKKYPNRTVQLWEKIGKEFELVK